MKKKNRVSKIIGLILLAILAAIIIYLAFELVTELNQGKIAGELSVSKSQQLLDETLSGIPTSTARGTQYILNNTSVKVNSVENGVNKDVILSCTYETLNAREVLSDEKLKEIVKKVYKYYIDKTSDGSKVNATAIQIEFKDTVLNELALAEKVSGEIEITAYQLDDGTFSLHCSDETVNTLFGGLIDVQEALASVNQITVNGESVDISNRNTLRTGINNIIAFTNYSSDVPETAGWLIAGWKSFTDEFRRNFIEKSMWKYLRDGLITTLELTGCALLIGILLGVLIAIIRVTNEKTGGVPILNGVCKVYLALIRGTPVMVQMLIIYFVILSPFNVNKFLSAVICFGINSGAYVSEIIRGGIVSVDAGQSEAGRSLGLSYTQTMVHIIIPQAFKIVLPSLANEFIALLKETSVAFYIGVADLTQAGILIRSITYSNFMPFIAVALIYFIIVLILTKLVGLLEKKLKQSERQGGGKVGSDKRKKSEEALS